MNETNILLESGTGEAEILKFSVASKLYAINVVKIKEVIKLENITSVPNVHKAILGLTLVRGEVIPVVDLYNVLEGKAEKNPDFKTKMILICEFNNMKVAFAADEVFGITRVRWDEMKAPDGLISKSRVVATIELNDKIYMLLDFENIVIEISPESNINIDMLSDIEQKRRDKFRIVLADDSMIIRSLLKDTLEYAGYTNLKFFNDGKEAYDYIKSVVERKGERFTKEIDLLITDIEMPKLDGHRLVRLIKEDEVMKKLPVVIFSSLITKDLKHKGEEVGADAQLSKPEIDGLVRKIDELLGI